MATIQRPADGGPATNEMIVRRYWRALELGEFDEAARLTHPDYQAVYPQSGERIVGFERYRAVAEHFPGGLPAIDEMHAHGIEDRYVLSPSATIHRVVGSGDVWVGEAALHYADGQTWRYIELLELRDGLIWRETEYFAAPFEAPTWRAAWVDRT